MHVDSIGVGTRRKGTKEKNDMGHKGDRESNDRKCCQGGSIGVHKEGCQEDASGVE